MVPSISFSGRECRHADKIFAFPARTEFSVTTAFEQNAVEDFNLIKMVALRFKELPPLVDSRLHNRVVIRCERYVGAVRFEEVLVNVEAWAKRFECRFQPFHCVLLF